MHTQTKSVSTTSRASLPRQPGHSIKRKTRQHQLVAEIAVAGLDHRTLSLEERADFYEGLCALLAPPGAESAKYAATCIRESQRAHGEIVAAVKAGKRGGAR